MGLANSIFVFSGIALLGVVVFLVRQIRKITAEMVREKQELFSRIVDEFKEELGPRLFTEEDCDRFHEAINRGDYDKADEYVLKDDLISTMFEAGDDPTFEQLDSLLDYID